MAAQPQIATLDCDVLVVGGGNAGFSAATSAAQSGAGRVLLIDKCPEEWVGGNSYFTAGAFRTVHGGLEDVLPLVNNVKEELIDLDPYTSRDFLADLRRVTNGRFDPELGKVLVEESNDAVKWLAGIGVRLQLSFNRQAYKVDGRYKFWGGMCLKTEDGGRGLMIDHRRAAEKIGVKVLFSTAARTLKLDESTGAFKSLEAVGEEGKPIIINAKAVVLAAGGFEANPRMRSQYLGPGWDNAYVRGTPYNTGECLEMAIRDISAKQAGQWSGCHSVAWDANAPAHSGDREISNEFTKSGYPLGITINNQGDRFFDEGSDIRNYTYAKFGRAILNQPQGIAFQTWDSKGVAWLRDEEYRDEIVEKIHASSIEELARKCADSHGLENPRRFIETVEEYNQAVYQHRKENRGLKWDPAVKDKLSTQSSERSLKIPKSNWALAIDEGPFVAVKVGCGVTFTFGGLAIDPKTAGVVSLSGRSVPGVFCAGEMVGGLFYENYPGGSGLTSGAVFGRKAGIHAAAHANAKRTSVVGSRL
ncbi:Fumarate reductase flavoprotein subunit [Lachnellula suecica]|uniref:Fumarate reductase flavoprotein subunit n=1 Tax=Lachnellula suecica TaxID=602035 RepID=A0A8T9C7T1_9HELO|nr:Fumarate reductase flavoprotein subunit [Lachnellula suecica]